MKIISALLLITLLVPAASAEWVCVKSRKANVRESPRMPSRVLRRDMQFTPYEVIGYFGSWVNVMSMDGQTGWIHGTILTNMPAAVVSGRSAVLHADLGEDAAPLREVPRHHAFRITGKIGHWLRVEDSRGGGWLRASEVWGNLDFEGQDFDPLL